MYDSGQKMDAAMMGGLGQLEMPVWNKVRSSSSVLVRAARRLCPFLKVDGDAFMPMEPPLVLTMRRLF
jgi:hypothetical protein